MKASARARSNKGERTMTTEGIVCRCQGVTHEEVVKSIRGLNLQTVKEVRDATGAGDGCRCCHKELRNCLSQHACGRLAGATGPAVGKVRLHHEPQPA